MAILKFHNNLRSGFSRPRLLRETLGASHRHAQSNAAPVNPSSQAFCTARVGSVSLLLVEGNAGGEAFIPHPRFAVPFVLD
ncbi:hypothetical protein [Serratia marcescens]|uniref:hypothetical protein n=1 Tax=Serratia marcescens TaxID=615 RepID=UPI0011E81C54|nr:hypothetical protein [Serratia marcescens]